VTLDARVPKPQPRTNPVSFTATAPFSAWMRCSPAGGPSRL
jgi:hypothetical protein